MKFVLESMQQSMNVLESHMEKVKAKAYGWKSAAANMRKETLELEKLLKQFRKLSVDEAKKG